MNIFQPKTWSELLANSDLLHTTAGGRLPEDQDTYIDEVSKISREQFLNRIVKKMAGKNVCLLDNTYPYTSILLHLPRVKHLVLWSVKPLETKEIETFLKTEIPTNKYFWFEQTHNRKTVPEICHVHVLINTLDETL